MTFDEPISFEEAVAFLRAKVLLPTDLDSATLRMLEAELKRRALFSARMTRMEFLQTLKRVTETLVSGLKDPEEGVYISIPEAKAQLQETLESIGYEPDPEDRGTIKDFLSDRRRQLVVETNVLDTLGYGRYKAENDPASVIVNPGWKLVRVTHSRVPRDWEKRWQDAGEAVGWLGASKVEMVALKNSPIWQALGDGAGGYDDTLGNPWPPFAFLSGMGVTQQSRKECTRLGLIQPGELPMASPAKQRGLNDSTSASLASFDEELRRVFENDPVFLADKARLKIANARGTLIAVNTLIFQKEAKETKVSVLRARVAAFLEQAEVAA